jgi:putative ABC transport system permease protein
VEEGMSIPELARRAWMMVRRSRVERDLRREMQFHVEMLEEDHLDGGAGAGDAANAARREFGNELTLREACGDAAGWASLDRLLQDVRHAARALGKDRRFTVVALLVLALGIGGNTTVFSLVNALVLNPFPYPHADRLVEIQSRGSDGSWYSTVRVADFAYWRQHATAHEAMATYGYSRSNLTGQSAPGFEDPERIVTGTATDAFLRVLGVAPALGRFFTPAEDLPGGPPVVVLSHGAWLRRYGGRRDILGETLTLDGTVRTIVGVMPAGLRLPGTFTCEAWVPAAYDVATNMQPGYDTRFDGDHVVARLKDGVPVARAETEVRLLATRLEQLLSRRTKAPHVRVVRLGDDLSEGNGSRLRLLSLIVGSGLLLACANLAGMLLARSGARAREIAVRASVGASRARLVRYALTETLLLAIAGGLLGLVLTVWGIHAIGVAAPPFLGLDSALRVDGPVLAFALGLSLVTGVAFGLAPAIHGSKVDLATVLKGTSGGRRARTSGGILSVLVVAEVAIALMLLVGGGLMVRSFVGLTRVDTGIHADGILTFRLSLSGSKYASASRRTEFSDALLDRLRGIPGVVWTAAVSPLPMSREYSGGGFTIEGRPAPADWRDMAAQYSQATPGYFLTMGIPVLLGREFDDRDGPATPAVLVNNALARRFFPGESPIGHRLARLGTIVGVVGDVRHNGPSAEPNPQIYYPFAFRPPRSLSVAVRTAGSPLSLAAVVRQQVHAIDGDLPVDRLKPMADVVSESIADTRLVTSVVGGFAVFALVLAAIGLYGVIAYSVSRRQQEIGIRMALGASRRDVLAMVLSRGALLSAAGIAIGVPAALSAARLMTSFLYRVDPHDLVVFTAVPSLLFVVALLASYLPARRAAGVDPLASLRAE